MTDPKKVADLVAKLDRFLSGNFYAPPVIREALEASSKTLETLSSELEKVKGALGVAVNALEDISSPTQTTNLLWWQILARSALASIQAKGE